MKKIRTTAVILLGCAISCFLMMGCMQSADKISSNQIIKLYNQQLKEQAQNQEYIPVKVGYYETTSPEERCVLKKLEAAGLLTVSFERFAWWEKIEGTKKVKQQYYDYFNWTTAYRTVSKKVLEYNFEDHIMATVTLTPEGKKLIMKSIPEPVVKQDKDMIQPVLDSAKHPECFVTCEENWPKIENPFIEKKQESTPAKKTEPKKETTQKETPDEDEVSIERRDNKQYSAYQAALQKIDETEVYLKGCTVKPVKARNIQVIKENGISVAVAEIILEKTNVTKAYSAIKQELNKTRSLEPVVLTYFIDKGWVIQEDDFQFGFMKEYYQTWQELCEAIEDAADKLQKDGEAKETDETEPLE